MDPGFSNIPQESLSKYFYQYFSYACLGALAVGLVLGAIALFLKRGDSEALDSQFNWIPALLALFGIYEIVSLHMELEGWTAFAVAFVYGLVAGLLSWILLGPTFDWFRGAIGLILSIIVMYEFYRSESLNKSIVTAAILVFIVCLCGVALGYLTLASRPILKAFGVRFTPLAFIALFGLLEFIQFIVSPFGLDRILFETMGATGTAGILTVSIILLAVMAALRPEFTSVIAASGIFCATIVFNIALWWEFQNFEPPPYASYDLTISIIVAGAVLGYGLIRMPGATFGRFHSNRALG